MPVQEGSTYKPVYLNAAVREQRNLALGDYLDRAIDRLSHTGSYGREEEMDRLKTLAQLILARETVKGW